MAALARNTDLTKISPGAAGAMKAGNLHGPAGAAIDAAGVACRIASDGTIMPSDGTALNTSAQFDGVSDGPAAVGETVTLLGPNTVLGEYVATSQTPGANLYLSSTPGMFDLTPTTGSPASLGPVARIGKSGRTVRVLRYL